MPDVFDQIHSDQQVPSGDVFDQIHGQAQSDKLRGVSDALNYRSGNKLIDAPLGVLQGAAKAAIEHVHNASTMIDQIPEVKALNDAYFKAIGQNPASSQDYGNLTQAQGVGQGTGKFLEGAAEYAAGSGGAKALTTGASLIPRMIGQAAAGGGVAALQSGGDPNATKTGAALGAGGELLSSAVSPIIKAATEKSPTAQNFIDSFAATPLQKKVINKLLPTLQRDGIQPADSVPEMQGAIKERLSDLADQFDTLRANGIGAREVPLADAKQALQDVRDSYLRNGIGVSGNASKLSAIDAQIKDVGDLATANNGKLTIDDIKHLRDIVNEDTDWKDPKWTQTLAGKLGEAYRSVMDKVAPETTGLNRDYAQYKQLEALVDNNIAMGRGTTKSGLTALLEKGTSAGVGASIGYGAGRTIGGPFAGEAGAMLGAVAGPMLTKPAQQMLRNLGDSGMLSLPGPVKSLLQKAVSAGDSETVTRLLGGVAKNTLVNLRSQRSAQDSSAPAQ
jgi:hypothetical protein